MWPHAVHVDRGAPLADTTSERPHAVHSEPPEPMSYTLIGRDGKSYTSETPGTLGGHRSNKIYGRLDCPGALRWIAKGHYVKQRVFFADEETARAAGYRPCARCLPERYAEWRRSSATRSRGAAAAPSGRSARRRP
jgi:Metal binding domain of Ada